MIRAPKGGNVAFGIVSVGPKRPLNRSAMSSQFHVLALIVADRDLFGVVEQNVGRHQHRIVVQADGYGLLTLGFVFELGHSSQLADRRNIVEQPGAFRVDCSHMALNKK